MWFPFMFSVPGKIKVIWFCLLRGGGGLALLTQSLAWFYFDYGYLDNIIWLPIDWNTSLHLLRLLTCSLPTLLDKYLRKSSKNRHINLSNKAISGFVSFVRIIPYNNFHCFSPLKVLYAKQWNLFLKMLFLLRRNIKPARSKVAINSLMD